MERRSGGKGRLEGEERKRKKERKKRGRGKGGKGWKNEERKKEKEIQRGIQGKMCFSSSDGSTLHFLHLTYGKLIMMITTIIDLQDCSLCDVGILSLALRKRCLPSLFGVSSLLGASDPAEL